MPELPEVETRIRQLGPPSVGETIVGVWNDYPAHIHTHSLDDFRQQITGQTIRSASRRAKYMLFHLDRDTLLIHLRMSGDLQLLPADAPPTRFAHTVIQLGNQTELRFSDSRKFGRVYLVADPQIIVGHLGPEPLADDFTAERFHQMLTSRKRQLKPLLLDQTFLAGVGNIYANDSLFMAKLHPLRRSDSLTTSESAALWRSVRLILEEGIENNGASIDWVYQGGGQQNRFRVHNRAGEACSNCQTPIERITVGQRGTFLCPVCQRLSPPGESSNG